MQRSRPPSALASSPRATAKPVAAAASATASGPPGRAPAAGDAVEAAKVWLLLTLASLDRGAAATASDVACVDAAVAALEALAGADSPPSPDNNGAAAPSFADRLSGLWRLVYSSTFAGVQAGSQGFTGPPGAPGVRLGAVLQRIQPASARLDNILELSLPPPLPFGLSGTRGPTLCVQLRHEMELVGEAVVRLRFTEAVLRLRGARGAHPLALPSPLRALGLEGAVPEGLRGGSFCTSFVDGQLRVSRGDRGELRVFLRA